MKKKMLSLVLTLVIAITIIPALSAPTFALTNTGVKFESVDAGTGVYKLVFSAKTPATIQIFSMTFTYDKSIIRPVSSKNTSLALDVPYITDPVNFSNNAPFEMLLKATPPPEDGVKFSFAPTKWGETTERAGFNISLYHLSRRANSNGAYIDLFEFYFKLQPGKTTNDIKAATFRIENAADPGNLLGLFFSAGNGYGVMIEEAPGKTSYYWGAAKQSLYPDAIDEIINPFDPSSPEQPGSGGSTPEPGGSTPEPGGSTPEPGGSTPEPGGSTPGTGGSTPEPGGSTPGTGGSTPEPGGSTPGTGGSTTNPGTGTPKPFPFTDIPANAWYYDDVKTAWETGLIDGTTATTFSPLNNLTYSEAIKLASCMHQLYTAGKVTLANGSPWYQSYVDYAKANKIISKDYSWSSPATRAGYMEIFANALPSDALKAINDVADGAIPDVAMSHPQAAAIYKLYRAGILQGVDKAHNCNPDSNIRRSEVAAVLTRMMNADKRVSFG